MKKNILMMAFIMLVCLLCAGCFYYDDYENYFNDETTQTEATSKKAVLMIYMVGSDLESENGFASMDIEEILESGFDDSNLSILLCTGGASYWWNEDISATECQVYNIDPWTGIGTPYSLEHDNMADPETLTEFMDYVYDNYEADNYSMILWNHGGGAVLGYGEDENYDYDMLTMKELDAAFASSNLIKDGKKLEWIGFDACLMGMLEVADTFSSYANYMIASEEVETGLGWDYSFLRNLSYDESFDGESAGKEIIDAYGKYYDSFAEYCPEYILSCMDLSKCDEVITALSEFVDVAQGELENGKYSVLAKNRDGVKAFGIISDSECYDTVDLMDMAYHFKNMFPDEAKELTQSVSDMVVYNSSNILGANGVAVYFPYGNKEYAPLWVEEYSKIGFANKYTGFIRSFTETLSGEKLADWDLAEMVPMTDGAETGVISVSLNENQIANFSRAKLSVWETLEDYEDEYVLWINSSDVAMSEEGVLSLSTQQKRFILGDSSGHESSCTAVEIERNEEYAVYEIPILTQYYDEKTGNSYVRRSSVHVKMNNANSEVEIIGVYDAADDEDGNQKLPKKATVNLKQGTDINTIAFSRKIERDDNGNLKPFEEWSGGSKLFDGFTLDGELTVSTVDIADDSEKCYVFFITDTQGNVYVTDCARFE